MVADIIAADLPKIPNPGELIILPRSVELHVGGHPANITIDLVNLGQTPSTLKVVGAVGKDIFGDFILSTIASKGIRTAISKYEVGTTKNIILVVKGQDRRFHVELGASWELRADDVIAALEDEPPKIFYLVSGMCKRVDEQIAWIMRRASDLGCITFLDIITPVGGDWRYIREGMRYSDIFHCNALEMLNITGVSDFDSSIRKMLDMGLKLMLLTDGERGAYAIDKEKRVAQPSYKVEAIDPTGAGDAFCAGILDRLLREGTKKGQLGNLPQEVLVALLEKGQAAGAACVTAIGTTTGVTTERVDDILKLQGEEVRSRTTIS